MKLKVLFVCAANYSRSVTAEKIANAEFGERIEAKSAGVHANERGVGGHTITKEDVEWADELVVMEAWHWHLIEERFPDAIDPGNVFSLQIADVFNPGEDGLVSMLRSSIKHRVMDDAWKAHGMKEYAPVDLGYLAAQCDEK